MCSVSVSVSRVGEVELFCHGVDHQRGENGCGREDEHAAAAELVVQLLQVVAHLINTQT